MEYHSQVKFVDSNGQCTEFKNLHYFYVLSMNIILNMLSSSSTRKESTILFLKISVSSMSYWLPRYAVVSLLARRSQRIVLTRRFDRSSNNKY